MSHAGHKLRELDRKQAKLDRKIKRNITKEELRNESTKGETEHRV